MGPRQGMSLASRRICAGARQGRMKKPAGQGGPIICVML